MRRFGDQDLMMHMTKWGPGACGKIKITKTLIKETSEGVESHTKTDIYR